MKPIYVTLGLIVLTVGLIYEVLIPTYTGEVSSLYQPSSGYKTAKQKIVDYTASNKQADEVIKKAKALQLKYSSITEADLDLLKIMVPDTIDQVKLHSEMANLLTSEGFPSDKLSLSFKGESPSISNAGVYLVNFSLEDSSYEKLKSFLSVIEHSKRLLVVKSINVTPASKVGDIYKFDITSEAYYVMPPKVKK